MLLRRLPPSFEMEKTGESGILRKIWTRPKTCINEKPEMAEKSRRREGKKGKKIENIFKKARVSS